MANWNVHQLSEALRSLGWIGHVAGALLVVLQTLFPVVPFVLVAGANVLIFGLWRGFLVNYVFACLGAFIAYYTARNYGRAWVQAKLAKYDFIEQWSGRLERHGLWYIAASRIIPVIPSFGINLSAAVMKVKPRDFVIGTLIGKAPMIFLESVIGHDLFHLGRYKGRLFAALALFFVLLIIGNYYKNKWTKNGSKS
ncbi:TVP38/TMEM64 family protein [Paenibacillus elgii]|uniref:TVP38/TMEM64 family protein n=1 Tax=Paenibacillus elgii TaxID=189691 RepID=UPI0013CFE04A|nr:TVP38/TMEM64 family protein [Paenibacillus elgii]